MIRLLDRPVLIFLNRRYEMASKTQKTEKIRDRKHAPNKMNLKSGQKRLQNAINLVQKLQGENK